MRRCRLNGSVVPPFTPRDTWSRPPSHRAGSPVGCTNIRLSSDMDNPLNRVGIRGRMVTDASVSRLMQVSRRRAQGVTVCTVGSEPRRASLSDRVLKPLHPSNGAGDGSTTPSERGHGQCDQNRGPTYFSTPGPFRWRETGVCPSWG
jgi:hypothetical protein